RLDSLRLLEQRDRTPDHLLFYILDSSERAIDQVESNNLLVQWDTEFRCQLWDSPASPAVGRFSSWRRAVLVRGELVRHFRRRSFPHHVGTCNCRATAKGRHEVDGAKWESL